MRNYTKQAIPAAVAVLLFILLGFNSMAQQLPKADNSVHDKMYDLIRKSDKVILPKDVTDKLHSININNPQKNKTVYLQTSVLKVLYNKALGKKDILFFGEQILKSSSASIAAINTDIKQLLTLAR